MDIKNKFTEWTYRIVCLLIIDSFIALVSITVLIKGSELMIEFPGAIEIHLIILFASIGALFFQVANILYWVGDINLFDFKKLWRKDE